MPDLPMQEFGPEGGGSFGGGAIVGPGRSRSWGSLLSVHAGCISDQMTGEMGPTYPRKNLGMGRGHLGEEDLLCARGGPDLGDLF